jgi:hypothetical protein
MMIDEFPLLKVAVTVSAAAIVTTQAPVPLHAPLHPANTDPSDAACVSVTCVPLAKFAVHVGLQLTPAGALVTVPVPVPASVIVKATVLEVLNVAVTDSAAVSVTTQAALPLHAPPQPANVDPTVAVGVSVTAVPLAKLAEQVEGQRIPAGVLVTVPVPAPPSVTVSVKLVAAPMVVVSLAVLLPVLGSGKSEATVAEFVIVPTPSGTMLTIMLRVALPPFATVPKLHVRVKAPLQAAPCEGVADTKVDWLGNVFITITFVASFGPVFVTVTA